MKLLRCKYDLVCPLGCWCGPALWMRKLGLRSMSMPFDWMRGDGVGLRRYVDVICDDFKTFMRRESLRKVEGEVPDPEFGNDCYIDEATGLESCHDFKVGVPFDEAYPAVRRKFDRRIERFMYRVGVGGRILFVNFNRYGHETPDGIVRCVERLRAKFPKSIIHLLAIEQVQEFAEPVFEVLADGVYYVRGRYFPPDRAARYGNKALCQKLFGSIRLRGRWRNLLRLRLVRLKMKVATMFHLSSEARRAARRRYKGESVAGD